ncbi:hypothetical protein D9M73_174850 [compost metagenome]
MEQQQRVACQFPLLLGDNQTGIGTSHHPVETARAQAIEGETVLLQGDQRIDIGHRCKAKIKNHGNTVMFE